MITVRIKGGLGNQLFQYAVGYALSKEINQELVFNPSFTSNMTPRGYKLSNLGVQYSNIVDDTDLPLKIHVLKNKYVNKACRIVRGGEIYRYKNGIYFLEKNESFQAGILKLSSKDIYLDGYFQSEKYFKRYRTELLRQIVPSYEKESEYIEVLDQVKIDCSVAIHVRRGDFKKDNSSYHYLLGEKYYRNALDLIEEHVERPTFFWFSDDIDWVKKNFGEKDNYRFVSLHTSHADIDEMMLMKNCHHIITANSTFSWWAAWLNEYEDAIRICPAKQYGNKDMIPESWIKVEME